MLGDPIGGFATDRRPVEEVVFTSLGVLFAAFSNYVTRRPILSRVYMYPVFGGIGFVLGRVTHDINTKRIADRELAIWDYVRRHPEDFPEIHPKKFKEVLQSWHPVR